MTTAETTKVLTFDERLEEAREARVASINSNRLRSDVAINDMLRREAIGTMTTILTRVVTAIKGDHDKLANRLKMIRRSEYGRVPEMVNVLAGLYAWPIQDGGDARDIPTLQDEILSTLASMDIAVTGDLLLDIKEAKGHHSFMDKDTGDIIDCLEPEYEEYRYFVLTFAEAAGLPLMDIKLTEPVWLTQENKIVAKLNLEIAANAEALAAHEAMMSA